METSLVIWVHVREEESAGEEGGEVLDDGHVRELRELLGASLLSKFLKNL